MRRIGIVVALVVILIVVLVLVLRPRGKGPEHVELLYPGLFQEAATGVSPDSLGPAWPEDPFIEGVRGEWRTLGFRDSTVCEEMLREWMYPGGRSPVRLVNVNQSATGRGIGLRERMDLGVKFLAHPGWRMGSMRYYPCAAAVLNSTEKSVLAFLAGPPARTFTANMMAGRLGLPGEAVRDAASGLAGIGWLTASGQGDSTAYTVNDPAIAGSPALQYLGYRPARGRSFDLVSIDAAFTALGSALREDQVTLEGPDVSTGRMIQMDLVAGRLRRGRPGSAWSAVVAPPGVTNGLFVNERAFEAWKAAHPGEEIAFSGNLVSLYHRLVEGTDER